MTVPCGWKQTTLGEECRVVSGATPKTGVAEYWGGDIAWITPDDLSGHAGKNIAHGRRFLTREGYESCSATIMPVGSVLFTSRAPIGYVAMAASEVCTNQGFKSFVPGANISSDFLYWYLRCSAAAIRELGVDTTFREVSKRIVSAFPIAYPGLPEQRRIVSAIEELFSLLDAANNLVERAVLRHARLRQAIINAALVSGASLVELTEIIETLRNGVFVSRPAPSPPGIRIFRISAVRPMELSVDDVRFAPGGLTTNGCLVEPGDLLFTRYSGNPKYVGACAVVPEGVPPTLYPDKLIRVTVKATRAIPEYVCLAVNYGSTRREIEERLKTTAGQVGIAGSDLRTIRLPLPSMEDQVKIVVNVHQQLASLKVLEASAIAATHRIMSLRKSILGRAFAGNLANGGPT